MGADHLVIFTTTPTGKEVVIKVGEDAVTDAYVLDNLHGRAVSVPQALVCGTITTDEAEYPTVIMTRVAGVDLATVSDQHRYLPELLRQMRLVHQVTQGHAAGTVRDVLQGTAFPTWKAYLEAILTGKNPEFDWERVCADPLVDAMVVRRTLARLQADLETLPEPINYHLLHGDLNPYNILVEDGHITGIIDWSYARYGDPLFDFARLRINPFIRTSAEATRLYFDLLELSTNERITEDFYFRFNLTEYLNWYVQSQAVERVQQHLSLLSQAKV